MKKQLPRMVLSAIVLFSLAVSIVLAQENTPEVTQKADDQLAKVSLVQTIYPPPGLTDYRGCG